MQRGITIISGILATALARGAAQAQPADDPLTRPISPDYAQRWLMPLPPARIFGNTHFVGFAGLGVVLIRTSDGLILIDGAVPQAVRDVEANIRSLGFRVEDIRYILTTEPHWDHAGGVICVVSAFTPIRMSCSSRRRSSASFCMSALKKQQTPRPWPLA